MKKITSICLVTAILIGMAPGLPPGSIPGATLSYASDASDASNTSDASPTPTVPSTLPAPVKDGYTLVPTRYSEAGIEIASSFMLTSPTEATVEEIEQALSIDWLPRPDVAQKNAKNFLITPSSILSNDTKYMFRLTREGQEDITWTFQTVDKFDIVSNFPRYLARNVPIKSWIEITFTRPGFGPIDDYFQISPFVSGHFEYYDATAVFVPQSLEYGTFYTVKLKPGVKVVETGEEIAYEFFFKFETAGPRNRVNQEPQEEQQDQNDLNYQSGKEFVNFNNDYVIWPSTEPPRLYYYISNLYGKLQSIPAVKVYKFADYELALDSVRRILRSSIRFAYAEKHMHVDTQTLPCVVSFDAVDYDDDHFINTMWFPRSLPEGFYLVDADIAGVHEQMIIQITDLPVQVVADDEKTLIWVNDIGNGKGAAGAEVRDAKDGQIYVTDGSGVAVIDRAVALDSDGERFYITAANGKKCVWTYDYIKQDIEKNAGEAYWGTLNLDRTLFKGDDAVSFFGYVQNRNKYGAEIDNVSAELTEGFKDGKYKYGNYGYDYVGHHDTYEYSSSVILQKILVPVRHGIYAGEMILPNLSPGSYCLTIYYGTTAIRSTYFEVDEYVKPPYKLNASADKKAAFAGETVTFSVNASFFEGTPVSDLHVSYDIDEAHYGELITSGHDSDNTDLYGELQITEKIVPSPNAYGQSSLKFRAKAELTEIGFIAAARTSVLTFINDIDVDVDIKRIKTDAALTVEVNTITLDRLNNGTATGYHDYIDAPVSEKSISVEIFRSYYETHISGEYYDFIEKKTLPTYEYEDITESLEKFGMVTGIDGRASKEFKVPDREYESYYVIITCVDGNGRKITKKCRIGRDYSSRFTNNEKDVYYLGGAEDSYDVGSEVSLAIRRGANTVENGNFLFVSMQQGIRNWQAGKNHCKFMFLKANVPSITVKAYYFNGYKYISNDDYLSKIIKFNYAAKELMLTATTDKASYNPGDTCNVVVSVKDIYGNAKEADVNISIVDEALFALKDYKVDTLESLYRTVNTELRFTSTTHALYVPSAAIGLADGGYYKERAVYSPTYANTDEGGEATYLREEFKDTAAFAILRTNQRGEAAYSFKLPDNLTSWRITMSCVNDELFAGNAVQNISVTLPMLLNYAANDTFLLGDLPTVGVSVHGSCFNGSETVDFEIWREGDPDVKYLASGAVFERVNVLIGEMHEEGADTLVIKATASNGTGDVVRHQYRVFNSYREIDEAAYCDVAPGAEFVVGARGLTNITFTDRSRGQYLQQLAKLLNVWGDRIEEMVARNEANRLIDEYYYGAKWPYDVSGYNPKKYQQSDGGISILPRASSDLATSVKLLRYIIDDIDANALKEYFYDNYYHGYSSSDACVLYGLAQLNEPVLPELQKYAQLNYVPVKDAIYAALGLCELGEAEAASELYDTWIAPRHQYMGPYCRVEVIDNNDDMIEATSAASKLAAILDKPEREGMYQYCIDNCTDEFFTSIEKLFFIKHELEKKSDERASITYTLFGEETTRQLSSGDSYTLRIPISSIGDFKITGTTGDVGAVSIFRTPAINPSMNEAAEAMEMGDADDAGDAGVGDADDVNDAGVGDANDVSDANNASKNGVLTNDAYVDRLYYYKYSWLYMPIYNFDSPGDLLLNQGDLIRIKVTVRIDDKSVMGPYCVTDYLPAGLVFIDHSAEILDRYGYESYEYKYPRYYTVEGQKISFYDEAYSNEDKGFRNEKYYQTIYYYARVISPGTFKAEGPVLQSMKTKNYLAVGKDATVVIE